MWCIGRNDIRNYFLDGRQVFTGRFPQFPKLVEKDFFIEGNGFPDMNHFVLRISKTFLIHEDFFVELLARSQAGEFDLDIFIRNEAGHADHVLSEVENLHGFAHVENKDLTTLSIGTCLKDEAYRFWNGHKEADDVRMRDRDRTSSFDLLLEEWDDRAVGTQDIAETNGYERRLGILRHSLDDHLTDALGCTHNVCGVDRFIGGDEYELFDFILLSSKSDVVSAEDVILYSFVRAVLHQRNMLMGSCMEDQLRVVFFKYNIQSVEVSHRTDDKAHIFVWVMVLEFLLEVVCGVFIDVQDHEHLRVLLDDLSAEFGTDGSATASDEDDLVLDICCDFVDVVLNLISAQKVFYADFTQFGNGDFPVHQLVDGRKGLDFGTRFLTDIDDVTSIFGLGARESNVDLIDAILLDELRDVFPAAFDRNAVDDASLLLFVVIDEAEYIAIELFGTFDLVHDGGTGHAGADDHDLLELVAVLIVVPVGFPGTEDPV